MSVFNVLYCTISDLLLVLAMSIFASLCILVLIFIIFLSGLTNYFYCVDFDHSVWPIMFYCVDLEHYFSKLSTVCPKIKVSIGNGKQPMNRDSVSSVSDDETITSLIIYVSRTLDRDRDPTILLGYGFHTPAHLVLGFLVQRPVQRKDRRIEESIEKKRGVVIHHHWGNDTREDAFW